MDVHVSPDELEEPMKQLFDSLVQLGKTVELEGTTTTSTFTGSSSMRKTKLTPDASIHEKETSEIKRFVLVKNLCEGVKSLLESLSKVINSMPIAEVFEKLPLTGQLLGRLCGFPELLVDKQIYTLLMRCILSFYKHSSPKSPLEAKAKSWAISQLRSTVSVPLRGEEANPLCLMGGDQGTGLKRNYFEFLPCGRGSKRRSAQRRGLNSPERGPGNLPVDVDFYLHMLRDPRLSSCGQTMLESLTMEPINKEIISLLRNLSRQRKSDPSVAPLSYNLKVILWLHDLSCLEEDTLSMIKDAALEPCPLNLESDTSTKNREYLVEACSDHPQLYLAVGRMLDKTVHCTQANHRIVRLVGAFHSAVRHAMISSSVTQAHCPLTAFYSPLLCPLVHCLRVSPADLTEEGILLQVKAIEQCLRVLADSGGTEICDVWRCLIHFPEWWAVSLLLCLSTNKQDLGCCVTLMLRFSSVLPVEVKTKMELEQMISTFQGLVFKNTLKLQDIQYTVSSSHLSDVEQVTGHLIGHILVVFLLQSKSGLSIGQDILKMACKTDCLMTQVDWLVSTTIFLFGAGEKNFKQLLSVDKLKTFVQKLWTNIQQEREHSTGTDSSIDLSNLEKKIQKVLNISSDNSR